MSTETPLPVDHQLDGSLLKLAFTEPFDADRYALFLRAKTLPEHQLEYDWRSDTYTLSTPARFAHLLGVDLPIEPATDLAIADHLFDYQRWCLQQALAAERFAVWLECGLGKTAIFLEWARHVAHRTDGRVLVVCPLQVIRQHQQEAERFYGAGLVLEHLATREDLLRWCQQPGQGFGITNYAKFTKEPVTELRHLAGLVADESSTLSRSGGGVIKWNLIKSSRGIPYKLSCTATPAPNETMEYASQASFLEKLRTEGEVIWTYFQRDKQGAWRVKPHARAAFYRFLASWSVYMRHTSNFGFSEPLASVPPPVVREHVLPISAEQQTLRWEITRDKGSLFSDDRLGVQERTRLAQLARGFLYTDGRKSVQRVPSAKPQAVADLVLAELRAGRQALVWTVFDEESAILGELLGDLGDGVAILQGSQTEQQRAEILQGFHDGDIEVLISKPVLIGYGLNFQHCRAMVFSGIDDSFERIYQSVRRAYRFGQTEPVQVHLPYIPELEGMMLSNVRRKETQFEADVAQMEAAYVDALRSLEAL